MTNDVTNIVLLYNRQHNKFVIITRAVSGQWLGKQVPVARQQILNKATIGLQRWKSCVSYVVHAKMLQARDKVSLVQFSSVPESVKRGLQPEAEE
jgi:hypothetical protein